MNPDLLVRTGPELPDHYGRTFLAVLMCNPGQIYAFWEVREAARSLFLRLSPTETYPTEQYILVEDLSDDRRVGNTYLKVPAGRPVNLVLGYWKGDQFQSQLVSNTLHLPNWNQGAVDCISESMVNCSVYPLSRVGEGFA
jgi:hypothetical protein